MVSEPGQGNPVDAVIVDVVYAVPERWRTVRLTLPRGSCVRDAVGASGLDREFPDLDLASAPIGVWGERVEDARMASNGDRIEIYRELAIDPREKRRLLAQRGETMGAKIKSG